jgi:hypothetical protein
MLIYIKKEKKYISKKKKEKKNGGANCPELNLDGLGKIVWNSRRFDANRPEIYFATVYLERF